MRERHWPYTARCGIGDGRQDFDPIFFGGRRGCIIALCGAPLVPVKHPQECAAATRGRMRHPDASLSSLHASARDIQHGGDISAVDIAGGEGPADPASQNEGDLAACDLLVLGHMARSGDRVPGDAVHLTKLGRQPDRCRDGGGRGPHPAMGQSPSRADRSKAMHHADGHRLAMQQPVAIAALAASSAWAKVWPRLSSARCAALALVARDDRGLGRAADRRRRGPALPVAGAARRRHAASSQSKKPASSIRPYFTTSA